MTIDLVFPVLPPKLDGIGDHTAHLGKALSAHGCPVRVLTAQRDWTSLSGVDVRRAFHTQNRRGFLNLVDKVRDDPPDWLLLQFEQISYGRWGLNPFVPLAIRRLRTAVPELRVAVMFHEDFMPASSLKFAVMTTWQRLQFWALGKMADVAFFSTEPRTQKYEAWFPNTSVHHLPVGSNIPTADASRSRERKRLGISPDCFVIGLFGSAHPSRLLSYADAAASVCAHTLPNCQVLYVGPAGNQVRGALDVDLPLEDAGALPAEDVSRHFAAMDLYLAPFKHGVSTRRGSFLTGLQHGLPTVTTQGRETGSLLSSYHDRAFIAPPCDRRDAFASRVKTLARSSKARHQLSQNGRSLYESYFSWSRIADKLLSALRSASLP